MYAQLFAIGGHPRIATLLKKIISKAKIPEMQQIWVWLDTAKHNCGTWRGPTQAQPPCPTAPLVHNVSTVGPQLSGLYGTEPWPDK